MLFPRALTSLPILASAAALAASPVDVRETRVWAGPDSTRVVLDLSGRMEHTLFTLHDPERVVVDLPGARLTRPGLPAGQGLIRQIRAAARDTGDLRIVLDLTGAVQAKSFLAAPNESYGYRLVIDLSPPADAAPVRAQHAPNGNMRDLVIAIDAGHGGDDPGAIGRGGTREKDVVLAIARALRDAVGREPGMRPYLTRDGDYFVEHRRRMEKARAEQADLFVSIHADSIRDRAVAGASVYVLSARGASDEAAKILAERENAADLIGGVSLDTKDDVLSSVLVDLLQNASMTASMEAAQHVLGELERVGEVRKPRVQQARFLVLKSPEIPSMLVETAYISNPQDERRLRDSGYQQRLASAILAGFRSYFYDNPPPGTRIAQLAAAQRSGRIAAVSASSSGPAESRISGP
jgi:N-acetylmuramoyl-L-alanine amidase